MKVVLNNIFTYIIDSNKVASPSQLKSGNESQSRHKRQNSNKIEYALNRELNNPKKSKSGIVKDNGNNGNHIQKIEYFLLAGKKEDSVNYWVELLSKLIKKYEK